jgi:hypothetical protein
VAERRVIGGGRDGGRGRVTGKKRRMAIKKIPFCWLYDQHINGRRILIEEHNYCGWL